MTLNGTIFQEFLISGLWWNRCLLEGPHGKVYITTENGVMELDSHEYLFERDLRFCFAGVFLEKFDMFVINPIGYIIGYYTNGSLAWKHELRGRSYSVPAKYLTLAPGGNELLVLDYGY